MVKHATILASVSLLLSACASDKPTPPAGSYFQANLDTQDTLSKMNYMTSAIVADDNVCAGFGKAQGEDDYYAVLGAKFHKPKPSTDPTYLELPLSYDAASRGLIGRILMGKKTYSVLTANITVGNTTLQPVTLFTLQHNSDTDNGEAFVTMMKLWDVNTAVRLSGKEPLSIKIDEKYTGSVEKMAMLSAGLEVAKATISTLVPQAHFLSVLDKPSLAKQAKVWDKALGSAISESAEESAVMNFLPEDVQANVCGVVQLSIPGAPSSFGMTLDPKVAIGEWRFGVTKTMPSLFMEKIDVQNITKKGAKDEDTILPPANPKVSPARVLNEPVGGDPVQSLASYILADKTVQTALGNWTTSLSDAKKKDSIPANQTAVCRTVVNALYDLGLTGFDARLGLWAMLEEMPIPGSPTEAAIKDLRGVCAPYMAPIKFPDTDLPKKA
jgi:hypothetical protein